MRAEKQARSIDYFLFIICYLLTQCNPGSLSHRAFHSCRAVKPPSAFCVFTTHKMATTGAFVLDLAGSGNLDSFSQPFMGFLFRHLTNPLKNLFDKSRIKMLFHCNPTRTGKILSLVVYVICRGWSRVEIQIL
jgi:hypothetical protein